MTGTICEHLAWFQEQMRQARPATWPELPADAWVNLYCDRCKRIYEMSPSADCYLVEEEENAGDTGRIEEPER